MRFFVFLAFALDFRLLRICAWLLRGCLDLLYSPKLCGQKGNSSLQTKAPAGGRLLRVRPADKDAEPSMLQLLVANVTQMLLWLPAGRKRR